MIDFTDQELDFIITVIVKADPMSMMTHGLTAREKIVAYFQSKQQQAVPAEEPQAET